MSAWEALRHAAVLGTGKQPFSLHDVPEEELRDVLRRLDWGEVEGALLRAAGVLTVWRYAGAFPRPAPAESCFLPAPVEELEPCSPEGTRLLVRLMEPAWQSMLPLWFERLAETRRRVPEPFLVAVLELGRAHAELRELIRPVLGQRGCWLAQQNPAWNYLQEENRASWEEGSLQVRAAYLRRVRRHDPEAGLELLQEAWNQEGSRERTELLEQLETGLSMADEPFLESALTDRSKEVRARAAELLRRLPQSRLVARMKERIRAMTTVQKKTAGALEMTLFPPETPDADATRDGITGKGFFGFPMGERALRLFQTVRAVPPSFWNESLGPDADSLVAAASACEWAEPLLAAWSEACVVFREGEWAAALLRSNTDAPSNTPDTRAALFSVLPAEQQHRRLMELLRSGDCDADLIRFIPVSAGPWDRELSAAALKALPRFLQPGPVWEFSGNPVLHALPRLLDPALSEETEVIARQAELPEGLRKQHLEHFVEAYRLKRQIMKM